MEMNVGTHAHCTIGWSDIALVSDFQKSGTFLSIRYILRRPKSFHFQNIVCDLVFFFFKPFSFYCKEQSQKKNYFYFLRAQKISTNVFDLNTVMEKKHSFSTFLT